MSDIKESLSNKEAKELGLTTYFSGIPCARGHLAMKYVDGGCSDCKRESTNRWREKNRDKIRSGDRQKYAANPAKFLQRDAKRKAEKPDVLRAQRAARTAKNPNRGKELYAANHERRLAVARAWRKNNPDKDAAYMENRRARKADAEGDFTAEDISRIRTQQHDKCGYCRRALHGKGSIDHIVALSRGGSNWPKNIQLLCSSCNSSKHNKDALDFARVKGLLL